MSCSEITWHDNGTGENKTFSAAGNKTVIPIDFENECAIFVHIYVKLSRSPPLISPQPVQQVSGFKKKNPLLTS